MVRRRQPAQQSPHPTYTYYAVPSLQLRPTAKGFPWPAVRLSAIWVGMCILFKRFAIPLKGCYDHHVTPLSLANNSSLHETAHIRPHCLAYCLCKTLGLIVVLLYHELRVVEHVSLCLLQALLHQSTNTSRGCFHPRCPCHRHRCFGQSHERVCLLFLILMDTRLCADRPDTARRHAS